MKTPDEIKKGLDCCGRTNCDGCPYDFDCETPYEACARDALAYIQQLESSLAQAERERDALMFYVTRNCLSCKHEEKRYECTIPCKWEWRGPCPEKTKEASDETAPDP